MAAFLFPKSTWAKIAGWLVAAVGATAGAGLFGKYTGLATVLVSVLSGLGIHVASSTSAGHPNG